jgi:hypothetical protein
MVPIIGPGAQECIMGRFGISFTDESGRGFKIDHRKHYATITHNKKPQVEGPFQRCLAWTSYIVMVLTSYFMMNAAAAAQDREMMSFAAFTQSPPGHVRITGEADAGSWTLRGLR